LRVEVERLNSKPTREKVHLGLFRQSVQGKILGLDGRKDLKDSFNNSIVKYTVNTQDCPVRKLLGVGYTLPVASENRKSSGNSRNERLPRKSWRGNTFLQVGETVECFAANNQSLEVVGEVDLLYKCAGRQVVFIPNVLIARRLFQDLILGANGMVEARMGVKPLGRKFLAVQTSSSTSPMSEVVPELEGMLPLGKRVQSNIYA